MKKFWFLLLFCFILVTPAFSQKQEDAEKLVDEGIGYHDKGDYSGAIKKYDEALRLDKDNLRALAEKGYTLLSMEKYHDCIDYCKKAIKAHPGEKGLSEVYVNYGTALDYLKRTDDAIRIYEEGINFFPQSYMLLFNKAVTLSSVKRYDESLSELQRAVMLNPRHPGSQNLMARILYIQNKNVPALLAFCRFFVLEQSSDRANENYKYLGKILGGNVKKNDKGGTVINLDINALKDTTPEGKRKENMFTSTEMVLSFLSVMDNPQINGGETEAEKLADNLKGICRSLKESKKDNYGFYWDFYVPYFVEMNDKELVPVFANIVLQASSAKSSSTWLKEHKDEVDKFYEWSKNFPWKTN